jgi:hypothetical protein
MPTTTIPATGADDQRNRRRQHLHTGHERDRVDDLEISICRHHSKNFTRWWDGQYGAALH